MFLDSFPGPNLGTSLREAYVILLMSTPVDIKSEDQFSGTSLRSLRDNIGYACAV